MPGRRCRTRSMGGRLSVSAAAWVGLSSRVKLTHRGGFTPGYNRSAAKERVGPFPVQRPGKTAKAPPGAVRKRWWKIQEKQFAGRVPRLFGDSPLDEPQFPHRTRCGCPGLGHFHAVKPLLQFRCGAFLGGLVGGVRVGNGANGTRRLGRRWAVFAY